MGTHDHEQHTDHHDSSDQTHRADTGADHAAADTVDAGGTVGEQVLDILTDVEKQFDRLRDVQRDHTQQLSSLSERSQALDEAETRLQEDLRQLQGERATLDEMRDAFDTARKRCDSEHAETESRLEATRADMQAREQALEGLTETLNAREAELGRQRHQHDDAKAAFEQERGTVESKQQEQWTALQSLEEELAGERRTIEAERASQQETLRAEREELDRRVGALDDRESAITGRESELIGLREELARDRARLVEDRERLEAEIESERAARAELDAEIEERERAISEKAASLDAARQELAEREAQLSDERTAIENERQQAERDRIALTARVDQADAKVQTLAAEAEQARTELEQKTAEAREAAERAETLRARVTDLEAAVAEVTTRSEATEAEALELVQTIEQERDGLRESLDRMKQDQADARQALENIEQERDGLSDSVDRMKQDQADARQTLENIQQERDQVRAALADIERERNEAARSLESAEQERATLLAERDEARATATQQTAELAELQCQLDDRAAHLADAEQKLAMAGDRLTKFKTMLNEQSPLLEKGAAAMATVEHQGQQIDRLTRQIAELQVQTDESELGRKDQRIAQLTEALRQARGQTAGDQDVAVLEGRINELMADLERVQTESVHARSEADEARRQLKSQIEQNVHADAGAAALAERETELEELRGEVARLETQLKQLRRSDSEAGSKHIESMKHRIAELEKELAEARQTATAAGGAEYDAAVEKLRAKAQKINVVAEHLRRRHARLRKMRLLASADRSQPESKSPSAAVADRERNAREMVEIDRKRQELDELQSALSITERRMMRKWARPKAAGTVVWLFILTLIVAAVSWFGTSQLVPPMISASVAIEAKTRDGSKLSEEDADKWALWHSEMLSDSVFHTAIAKRMTERRIDRYNMPDLVTARLKDDLTVDRTAPAALTLTLVGNDRGDVRDVLDIVAATLAAESSRQLGKRSDGGRAVIADERREGGLIRYATINPIPIEDRRLIVLGPVFGILLAISLTLVGMVYSRLVRAKRAFDEDNALVDFDTTAAA